MSETFGSINFGSIPVAASGGISVLGARQGVWNNGGYIELGNTSIGDTSTYITNERYIVLGTGGTLWALHTANYGWRVQNNGMIVINSGEEWGFIQDGATRSVLRIESLKTERGIQWYNTGAPTGERAFVGWSDAGSGNLIVRNNAAIPNAGIRIESNGGGNVVVDISGNMVAYIGAADVVFGNFINITNAGSGVASMVMGLGVIQFDSSASSLKFGSVIGSVFAQFDYAPNEMTFLTPVRLGNLANSTFELSGVTAGAVVMDAAQSVSVVIGGVAYKLALAV